MTFAILFTDMYVGTPIEREEGNGREGGRDTQITVTYDDKKIVLKKS